MSRRRWSSLQCRITGHVWSRPIPEPLASSSTFLCDRCGTVLAQMWSSPALGGSPGLYDLNQLQERLRTIQREGWPRGTAVTDPAAPLVTAEASTQRLAQPFGSATGGAGQWSYAPSTQDAQCESDLSIAIADHTLTSWTYIPTHSYVSDRSPEES